jgi:signal transduction histidine kinase
VKHARAHQVVVDVETAADGRLVVRVVDDGVGGADPEGGSGLKGLTDRVAAVGGTLQLAPRQPTGTCLTAVLRGRIPCD